MGTTKRKIFLMLLSDRRTKMAGTIQKILSSFGFNIGNLNDYPIDGTKYFVILGTSVCSFSKISGIYLRSVKTMGVNEGGMNEPYIVEEPNSDLNTLRFEKGFGTIDVLNMVNKIKTMLLLIKGRDNKIQGAYYTSRMIVKDITLSDLDAGKSTVLIQTMIISYTYLKKSEAIVQAAGTDLGNSMLNLLDYNSNDEQTAQIKAYSKKLSEQKQASITANTAKKQTEKQIVPKNPDVDTASAVNKQVQQKKEEEKLKEKENQQKKLEEIKNNLEL